MGRGATGQEWGLTTLGLALLALVNAQPRSGYALRKVFEDSPVGRFSSSPGSIYPALKKLESLGLVESRPGPGVGSELHATRSGRRALLAWLAVPVTATDYDRDPDLCFLRFAFLDAAADSDLTLRYLESFQSAVKESLSRLRAFLRGSEGAALTLHGRLAVEHGIAAREAALRWARHALETLPTAASGK